MPWTKPDFEEISLGMEVTAYVNTDDRVRKAEEPPARAEEEAPDAAPQGKA
jgi:coenzyme PQQ precursor peptide PqqA